MSKQAQNKVNMKRANDIAASIACPLEDEFGFAGTIRTNYENNYDDETVAELWRTACHAVALTFIESNPEIIETLLRAVARRKIADEVGLLVGKEDDLDLVNEAVIETISDTRTERAPNTGKPSTYKVWGRKYHQIKDHVEQGFNPPRDFTNQMGWVLAFQNALYHLANETPLEEALITTVGGGGDTDTNAAICGALLGAIQGREAVPERWQRCRPG